MGNKNTTRRTKYHDFRDANGKTIPYSFLAAVLGETERWIRTRLSQEKKIPTDVHAWVKRILAPGTKKITELKVKQEELETGIKEEKLREIQHKNEITEGKYGLIEDFQRELDTALIRLQTNLYAVPESVVDAMMTSRDRNEAKQILLDALEHHMREVSEWQIELSNGEDSE